MTDAWAIKGPGGEILHVEVGESEEFTWYEFNCACMAHDPKSADEWKKEGYQAAPVTVSEDGEADNLLRECLDWGLPDDLKRRIDAYLSRGQG